MAGGILQNTIRAMNVAPIEIMAYLGPAIGPDAFEVGRDVVDVFTNLCPNRKVRLKVLAAVNSLLIFMLWPE